MGVWLRCIFEITREIVNQSGLGRDLIGAMRTSVQEVCRCEVQR